MNVHLANSLIKQSVHTCRRLAAYSWARLQPRPNIILLGKDAGVPELAQEVRLEVESFTTILKSPPILMRSLVTYFLLAYYHLVHQIGALHSADIRVNEYGTPQLDSLFEVVDLLIAFSCLRANLINDLCIQTAYKLSPSKVFVFINSDIVLFDGFVQACEYVSAPVQIVSQ